MKKKPLPVPLDEVERPKVEATAKLWGVTLSGAIRRMIREHKLEA